MKYFLIIFAFFVTTSVSAQQFWDQIKVPITFVSNIVDEDVHGSLVAMDFNVSLRKYDRNLFMSAGLGGTYFTDAGRWSEDTDEYYEDYESYSDFLINIPLSVGYRFRPDTDFAPCVEAVLYPSFKAGNKGALYGFKASCIVLEALELGFMFRTSVGLKPKYNLYGITIGLHLPY